MKTQQILIGGSMLILAAYLINEVKNYFTPKEWQGKLDQVNPKLPKALNLLRHIYGLPIIISGHADAVARHLGDSLSQHNVDKWGQSNAVDFFPQGITRKDIPNFIGLMQQAGFTGIGVYLDTDGGIMFHGDVREDRTPANPAMWARIDGEYVEIERAYA